jgi:hypothetical protein
MLVSLTPYDRGLPYQLWCDGKYAVISWETAGALWQHGVSLSSEYVSDDDQIKVVRVSHQSPYPLNLKAALQAATEGQFRLSKKALALLRAATLAASP